MANPGTEREREREDERGGEDGQERERVMRIRFRRGDETDLRSALRSLDAGERPSGGPFLQRVYHDIEDFHRVTRPKNLQLLHAIAEHEPTSIRETARVVGRDVSQVHRNVEELSTLGLVRFETGNQGAKRPTVWYDAIEVSFPLDLDVFDEPEGTSV